MFILYTHTDICQHLSAHISEKAGICGISQHCLSVPADRLFFEKGSDFMKLEKLSDTQIRCTLSKEDLTQRQLHLSELAYGSEKA